MDKMWFWFSYGRNDIRLVRFNQTKDKTVLPNWNAKLNWQASSKDQVSFFFFNGSKEKFGRSLGAAGTEPDSLNLRWIKWSYTKSLRASSSM